MSGSHHVPHLVDPMVGGVPMQPQSYVPPQSHPHTHQLLDPMVGGIPMQPQSHVPPHSNPPYQLRDPMVGGIPMQPQSHVPPQNYASTRHGVQSLYYNAPTTTLPPPTYGHTGPPPPGFVNPNPIVYMNTPRYPGQHFQHPTFQHPPPYQ